MLRAVTKLILRPMKGTHEVKEVVIVGADESHFSMEFDVAAPQESFDIPGYVSQNGSTERIMWPKEQFGSWQEYLSFVTKVTDSETTICQRTPDNDGVFLHTNPAREFEVYELDTLTEDTTRIIQTLLPPIMRSRVTTPVLHKYMSERDSALLVARFKDEHATLIGFCTLETIVHFPDERALKATPFIGNNYRDIKIGYQLLSAIGQWASTRNLSRMVNNLPSTNIPLLD